ncbi:MAG TPA: hypothetical protein VD769_05650 [Gaiellaceae bacterium]|nr:hypothetical protein [Gaiellaceae bacterium]
MSWRWATLTAGAVLATGVVVAVAGTGADRSAWRELPAPPLSPREYPTGFWTGQEVVLVGGSDAPPCPPNADCVGPTVPPLADGAAYDPLTDIWRAIADAPVRFSWADAVVVGSTAYLLIPGEPDRPEAPNAFLAYRIAGDRWDELDLPDLSAAEYGRYTLVAAGERLVAISTSDEQGDRADLVFDPKTSTWSELPDDPLWPGFDRVAVWDGEELLLFDHELKEPLGDDLPLRGAALDLETGEWRVLDDPDVAWMQVRPSPAFLPGRPVPEEARDAGTTEVEAGDDRLLFLGSSWPDGYEDARMDARAWLWSPGL